MAKKNPRTINEFLLYTLGLQLTSRRWSWDARGEDVVVMKLWEKRRAALPDGTVRIEVWAAPPWAKPAKAARNERWRNIERLKGGGATYAVLRGGDGSDDNDSRDYDADRMVRLSRVQVDPDGYEYAVVDREVTVSDFLARGTGVHATPVTAAELTTLLASLGAPGVITKNSNPDAQRNYRPRSRHPGDMLDGYWAGRPGRIVPGSGFALHLVERHNELWLGDYLGTVDEGEGRVSLIVGDAQRLHITDLDLDDPAQQRLKAVLKQAGAVTYSYFAPDDWDSEGDPGTASTPDPDGPAYRMAQVKQRLHQRAFRAAVFARHGKRCVVTGCDVEALLDAAHLDGRSWVDGDNTAADGIPLRVDLHRAYDAGLITLDENHQIQDIAPALEAQYRQYQIRSRHT